MKLYILYSVIAITLAADYLTVSEFVNCVKIWGWKPIPSQSIAKAFISQAESKGHMTSRREAFMAIAQMGHESAGFTAKSEWACSGGRWSPDPCDKYNTTGCPAGRKYYGRGYIQLTHCYNYKAAAKYLNDQRIVTDPDIVARNETFAMATAMWFWENSVHNYPGVQQGQFGAATKAINGGYECAAGGSRETANKRWQLLVSCLKAINTSPDKLKITNVGC